MSPSRGSTFDIEALSGISGSISIACWVVVFSPQIIENFKRSSAEGLSLTFIIIWLLGDVFNILGAVLQGVLPTMTILAVYYTVADIVLLAQCLHYKGFSFPSTTKQANESAIDEREGDTQPVTEQTSLLKPRSHQQRRSHLRISDVDRGSRSGSMSSIRTILSSSDVDATHLSPATPFVPPAKKDEQKPDSNISQSGWKTFAVNFAALIAVCAAGTLGWWLSTSSPSSTHNHKHHHHGHRHRHHNHENTLVPTGNSQPMNIPGQFFGYLCAALYLGSRIPQLLLNARRKSTQGLNILFFLFACVGNATYVLSILAYQPTCTTTVSMTMSSQAEQKCTTAGWKAEYARYMLVNASWLIGSAGTLVLDFAIFVQFWVYRNQAASRPAIIGSA